MEQKLFKYNFYLRLLLLVSSIIFIFTGVFSLGFFIGNDSTYKLMLSVNINLMPPVFWLCFGLFFITGFLFGRIEYALQLVLTIFLVFYTSVRIILSPFCWDITLSFLLKSSNLLILLLWVFLVNLLILRSLFISYKAGKNDYFVRNAYIAWFAILLFITIRLINYFTSEIAILHGLNVMVLTLGFSFIIQSFLFEILAFSRIRNNHYPLVINTILPSVYEVVFAMMGLLVLLILSWILVFFFFIPHIKRKALLHYCMCIFARCYVRSFLSKIHIEKRREDFSKPAVIIANHQSILDVLISMSFHPKIIVLTNKWVWNSPLFGPLVRMADYYSVTKGIDSILPKLRRKYNEGYSIVVFPEGTRSANHEILRFKKGAFYLAKQLEADILPVVIHGTGYTYAKNNFWGIPLDMHATFYERIKPIKDDDELSLLNQSREMRRFFIREYNAALEKYETPEYFAKHIYMAYVLKGYRLQKAVKTELKQKYIREIHDIVPRSGIVHCFNTGYGVIPFSLYLASKDRRILVYERDEDALDLARSCYVVRDENIIFFHDHQLALSSIAIDSVVFTCSSQKVDEYLKKDLFKEFIKKLTPKGNIVLMISDYLLVLKKAQVKRIEKLEIENDIEAELINSGEDDYLLLNFKKTEEGYTGF